MTRLSHLIPPVPESAQDKFDAMDWSQLPAGTFDMNFRPLVRTTAQHGWRVLCAGCLGSAVTLPVNYVLGLAIGPGFANGDTFAVAMLCGSLLGLAVMTRLIQFGAGGNVAVVAGYFAAPMLIWGVVALVPFTAGFPGAVLYLSGLAIPAVAIVADQIATHAVHWVTANPRVPLEAMLACRRDWTLRFKPVDPSATPPTSDRDMSPLVPDELRECRRQYLPGFLSLVGCVALPVLVVLLISSPLVHFRAGFEAIILMTICLFLGGFWRTATYPGALRCFCLAVLHFIYFGDDGPTAPGVFRSPCGSRHRRRLICLVALLLLATATSKTADYFTWFILTDWNRHLMPPGVVEALLSPGPLRFLPAIIALRHGEFYLAASLLASLLACIVVPGILFLLVTFLVAAPAVTTYTQTLETKE